MSPYDSIAARKAYFDNIYKSLGLQSMEDWYKITSTEILKFGEGPLKLYNRSFSKALEETYRDHAWESWRFQEGGTNRKRLWDEPNKRREFLEALRKEVGWNSLEDLYKLNKRAISSRGAWLLLREAKNSIPRLVQSAYPEHEWIPWKFAHIGASTWADEQNVRKFFEYCQKELKIESFDDWYQVKGTKIASLGGRSLLVRKFNNSLPVALKSAFPEHEWLEWKFRITPMGWWKDKKNQKKYLEWLGKTVLKVESMQDWYKLTKSIVTKNHGMRLLAGYHNQSCLKLLRSAYPDHEWLEWKFLRSRKGFWENPANRRRFLEHMMKQKGIITQKVSIQDIEKAISVADIDREGGS
jgi:hypothetical protein